MNIFDPSFFFSFLLSSYLILFRHARSFKIVGRRPLKKRKKPSPQSLGRLFCCSGLGCTMKLRRYCSCSCSP
ncbi:hypothetical protein F4821DRAFT_228176 [Hypoxylon rubiginosum]|uniref:Uncharacterized protein n=1 Tax=Hypoxylon rubiginosum TaxID=110542 RepID=A0ACC0DEV7_9PEZI|nr:hypothetical protein F4821DRAFT_228176 [Hypoxylon rubiginosum]